MVLLIKSTSTQQDRAEQLDGTTHDTDGGGFKIKSLSAHSINKIDINITIDFEIYILTVLSIPNE